MWESKDFCASYLIKFPMDLDGIRYTFKTFWPDKPSHFVLSDQYSRERTLLSWFLKGNLIVGLRWHRFCLKKPLVIDSFELYSLMPVWMTLTFIQGPSCMRKQKSLYSFSFNNLNEVLSLLPQTSDLLKVYTRSVLHDQYWRERTLLM